MKSPTLLFLAGTTLAFATAAARTQAALPTIINSVPFNITQSGDYELGANFNFNSASGVIISVNASNVTIDFKNHFIAGPVGNTSQTVVGIRANERSNLTLKNGTIAFCRQGVFIDGNNQANTNNVGHRIENMRVTFCTFAGLQVANAPGSIITDCQISKIGGSQVDNGAFGIVLSGSGAAVTDCSVGDVRSTTGNTFGIALSNAFATRNRIANAAIGISGGKFQNNLTLGVPTPFSAGTNAGGNN